MEGSRCSNAAFRGERSLPFSPRLDIDISPGTYRFEFRFTVDVTSGSARTVHSRQFAVSQ